MSAAFGVHFGATSACLAVCKDGKADVVANDSGDRTTPSIVAFTDHEQSVGLAAKQGLIRNASNTVCNVKHILGRTSEDPQVTASKKQSSVKMIEKAGKPHYEVEYKEKCTIFTPGDITTKIYQNMREIADHHGEAGDCHDAVLTVPLHFNDKQRHAIRIAAEKGGFNILRIIDEPSAALLAYDIGQNNHHEDSIALVYRLGGTSLDVTVVSVCNGMYRILATKHVMYIGGRTFTDVLVTHFVAEFKRQWKSDCAENKRSMAKLRNASENAKHVLSTMPSAQCSVDSLLDGIDFNTNISRGRFEGLISSTLTSCIQPVGTVLEEAKIEKTMIDKVVLCGGSAKIPLLQKHLKDFFPNADVLTTIPPDEVLAVGASKEASLLEGYEPEELRENEQHNELPALSADILIQQITEEGASENQVVLQRDTPIPVRRQQTYTLGAEQTDLTLHLFYSVLDGQTEPLAQLVIEGVPAGCLVNTVFHVHSDGTLHVTCTEPTSNKSQSITIDTS